MQCHNETLAENLITYNLVGYKTEEGRDVGAMVSILTVAVQQLAKNNEMLQEELCKKDGSYQFCS